MEPAKAYAVVLVTAPDLKTARRLARAALEERLAACVSFLPGIESHYWWRDRLESSREVLLLFKTARRLAGRLERCLLARHPYDTPEILLLPLGA
ncbi:MAG: divalent cation tolerance protein CutA, partial [Verrucomicrobia bacterium]|nr:divalent cation tolerance protein CutA [Verrucomicrobiota bacterium]